MVFDIIGDIHGYADRLKSLLKSLGYVESEGAYRHSDQNRRAIFVGDFVDRGPQIPEAVLLVRSMVEAGSALATMGNHEYNAICFHTRKPGEDHRWMRTRNDSHINQHIETLYQFRNQRRLWEEHLAWFSTLPLYLDLAGIRVIHAAWDPASIDVLRSYSTSGNSLTDHLLPVCTLRGTPEFQAIQNILKGIEIQLPSLGPIVDKDGIVRQEMRVRWWLDTKGKTLDDISFADVPGSAGKPIPDSVKRIIPGYTDPKPVFVGHYWLEEKKPHVLASNVACLDYSVANGGYLAAYSWSGESELCNGHFSVA